MGVLEVNSRLRWSESVAWSEYRLERVLGVQPFPRVALQRLHSKGGPVWGMKRKCLGRKVGRKGKGENAKTWKEGICAIGRRLQDVDVFHGRWTCNVGRATWGEPPVALRGRPREGQREGLREGLRTKKDDASVGRR